MSTRRVPPAGTVDFGELRRRSPISADGGFSRGAPLDRHYIERFLDAHRADVRGAVLEVEDSAYTRRYGGANVTHSDVLHLTGARLDSLRARASRNNLLTVHG